jgi:hypothetical protein
MNDGFEEKTRFGSASTLTPSLFKGFNSFKPIKDSTKNSVFAIEPRSVNSSDKELRTISVGSSISHWKYVRSMLNYEVLIIELLSINGFASSSVLSGEITSLDHELLNDSVERTACVSELFALTVLLASTTQLQKVSGSLRSVLAEQTQSNRSRKLLTTNFNIDFNLRSHNCISSLLTEHSTAN